MPKPASSWLELSRSAWRHNISLLKKIVGPTVTLAACIKGNGYGHGLPEMIRLATAQRLTALAVNSASDLETVRQFGFTGTVLVMGPVSERELSAIAKHQGSLFVYGQHFLKTLAAKKLHVDLVLLLDTGMTRDGVRPNDLPTVLSIFRQHPQLKLQGVATHFATADEPDNPKQFRDQLALFNELKHIPELSDLPLTTAANSAAALLHPEARFNLVRTGIIAYGLLPSPQLAVPLQQHGYSFKPILSWKTILSSIRTVPAGTHVSYGATFTTTRRTRVGLLPTGYYDGLDRGLSNQGKVLIGGQYAPIIGRVCMNMTMVDLTKIPAAKTTDEVVIIGSQKGKSITVDDQATLLKTINYEVVTRLPTHLPRLLVL